MRWKLVWKKPVLTMTQFVVLLVILFGLFVALDLNRRAQAGRLVGKDEETLREEVEAEKARTVELEATLEYVQSEAYVYEYAIEEGGMLLPGEKEIVVFPLLKQSRNLSLSQTGPDPAQYARPWQAWWQLLTDIPMPTQ